MRSIIVFCVDAGGGVVARRALAIPMGDRIRFHREARRKTQAVVAGLAGISDDYLSQIERPRLPR